VSRKVKRAGAAREKVSSWERMSVKVSVMRERPMLLCFVMPLVASIASGVLAAVYAPHMRPGTDPSRFSAMFATTGGLIGALLIALAVEAGWLRAADTNMRRRVLGFGASYIAVGAAAAVVALNPALSPAAYHVLFTAAMAAGVGALISVLAIAYYVAESELRSLREHAALPDAQVDDQAPR